MRNILARLWRKCWFKLFLGVSCALVLVVLFRNPLLRGIGHWLGQEDQLQLTDACFVLGGNSFERGLEACKVYFQISQQQFYPTGGNYPLQIQALDTVMTEAQLTAHLMHRKGVPLSSVHPLSVGTSTMEESNEILRMCTDSGWKKITVISSALHLRRIRQVFAQKFQDKGIEIVFHGSDAADYNKENWWKSEEGLIMGQNELVKIVYYWLKY
jgi:uncharacterized SAM-binding protein YcdF (DUF218 family)